MPITNEQIQAVENAFFAAVPEAIAYKTDSNLDALYNYILGAFPESVLSVAAWEIAFKSCKLKKIAGWVAPVTEEQRRLYNSTPAHLVPELYKNDKIFKAAVDAIVIADKERDELLEWCRVYQSMDPEEAASRIVNEPGFSEAVDKLVEAGLI
jgi:hypothetical protein